jgi:hypothetical protein
MDATVATADLLRLVACGSVDDGKSTLLGRLMFDCGALPDDQLAQLRRDSRNRAAGPEGIDFSLALDGLIAEREQNITIDVAYRYFETPPAASLSRMRRDTSSIHATWRRRHRARMWRCYSSMRATVSCVRHAGTPPSRR